MLSIMADIIIKCPLCCNKTFTSKILLIEHLANTLAKLYCPICGNKWSSVAHLIEHLNLDNCQPDSYTVQTFNITTLENNDANQPGNSTTEVEHLKNAETVTHLTEEDQQQTQEVNINDNKMYVELLSKEMLNPCLQTQELKFIQEEGGSRYVIIEQPGMLNTGSAVLTKQNHDGTISLTTVKDFNMETETLIAPAESQAEDTQEEIYSCNMCGVSFSSVLEHIQNYHNDQEVVVEEPLEETEENISLNNVLINEKLVVTDPLQIPDPRRVITETGDIVEESVLLKTVPTELLKDNVEKQTRATKRFVQIDKFCDSIVKDIEPNDEKGGPYHKVIVKDIESSAKKISKMYHCISCNFYVSSLNEFKSRPCKTLKYSCPHCPVAYENSKSLCAHMKVHKGQMEIKNEPSTYECEICCTTFQTNKSLKLHKRMHDPIKARPIEAPVKTEGGVEDRYQCCECNKMIPVEYRTIHQQSHKHKNEMNCAICNKKFHSSEYLEMHMRVHNLDKAPANKADASLPYACLYCTRRFGKPHEKVKHERIHTGEKPHACEICGKSFRVSYCLTLHMRTHTGARPYACDHCGKRFKAHSVYNHHLLTHSEKRAYKCPFCPKAFKTSVQLAGHKNSHTKPFSCQHCNRPFASLYAVRVHMETHTRHNNLKFSCHLCGASYARAFALKDHVKHAHQQDVDGTDIVTGTTREEWTMLPTEDTDANSVVVEKDIALSEEVTPLGISSNELIVP